jgi:hypothetical protein
MSAVALYYYLLILKQALVARPPANGARIEYRSGPPPRSAWPPRCWSHWASFRPSCSK